MYYGYFVLNQKTEILFVLQVSIDFDRQKAQPHDDVHVIVTADPASIVNLLAVDQSVLLLKSGNDITASEVLTLLELPLLNYFIYRSKEKVKNRKHLLFTTNVKLRPSLCSLRSLRQVN